MTAIGYWNQARLALSAADPMMGKLIGAMGDKQMSLRGDAFYTLARAIVGQQISTKAAASIWARVESAANECKEGKLEERLLKVRNATMRACGLSERKAQYLTELAKAFVSGAIDPKDWVLMSDDEVKQDLTQLHGIGPWTAEMFLIFNLARPDVFALDDVGLQRAAILAYDERYKDLQNQNKRRRIANRLSEKALVKAFLEDVSQAWKPWRTVAAWYLWQNLDAGLLERAHEN